MKKLLYILPLLFFAQISFGQIKTIIVQGGGGGACDTCIVHVTTSADSSRLYYVRQNGSIADSSQWIGNVSSGGGSGSTSRFGIEDNLGIQDRSVDMEGNYFSVENFSSMDLATNGYKGHVTLSDGYSEFGAANTPDPNTAAVFSVKTNGATVDTKVIAKMIAEDQNSNRNTFEVSTESIKIIHRVISATENDTLFFPLKGLNPLGGDHYFIPISVNNNFADSTGNITIAAGGGSGLTDSVSNSGYATVYSRNKARDSVQTNINANTSNIVSNTSSISLKKDNTDSTNSITGYTPLYRNGLNYSSISNAGTGQFSLNRNNGTKDTVLVSYSPPIVTTAQMNAISSPVQGQQVYNSDEQLAFYYSTNWGWISDDLSWQRNNGWQYKTEFTGASTTTFNDGILINILATGGSLSSATSTANHPGITIIGTSNNASGNAQIRTLIQPAFLGGGRILFEEMVKFPILASATEAYSSSFGLTSNPTVATLADAIVFTYDSIGVATGSTGTGNWQVATSKASVRSYTNTGIPVVANQWYKLKEVINAVGTQVDFYIDNVLVKSETTNIPIVALDLFTNIIKSAGTTSRTVYLDYLFYKIKFTTPR